MIRPKNTRKTPLASIPLDCCLAKSRVKDGVTLPGRTVEEHCRITGAVAKALLAALPPCTTRLFPENSDIAVSLHDIGKVFPYFQGMIHKVTHYPQPFPQLEPFREAQNPPGHASISRAALIGTSPAVAEIAGWHHGFPPERWSAQDEICGGEAWQQVRLELLCRLLAGRALPTVATEEQKTLLKGLTAVADWISSGSRFDDPDEAWLPLVHDVVEGSGFSPLSFVPDLRFEDIFGFAPNGVQKAVAETVTGPGVYALEAPMGMGKTEAALFASYKLLTAGKAGGIYFALPTQLTSNRIFDRLLPFLHRTLAPESRHAAAMLLHAMAWLHATHHEEGPNAASWFEQSKRGLLAPFGAGTLDQALMAVINVRHSAVRSFGLAGKVVILDEIHSYDAYTGTLLDALVAHLRKLGCTVILLSATLTQARLARVIGKNGRQDTYPRITAIYADDETETVHERSVPENELPQNADVRLCLGSDEEKAVLEALMRAEQGQQVLWVENSVAEAQKVFRLFAGRAAGMAMETGLLHSRFTPSDRQKNETYWTTLYGRNAEERSRCGRILVGTQVLEQSLDIDADFLVTRICPTDMLFQRMGRLWRHEGTKRPAGALREAWVLCPALEEALAAPSAAFGVSGVIYAPYVLARTLEIWSGKERVTLPADIRPLLEATYADRAEEPSAAMKSVRQSLLRKVEDLHRTALFSQSDGKQLNEQAASTRFAEETTCPVLLVRRLSREGCLLADGQDIRFDHDAPRRRDISAALFANIVRIRQKDSPFTQSINAMKEKRLLFQDYLPVKENYEPIYLARIRPDETLEDLCSAGRTCGRYTSRTGWEKESLPS